MKRKQELEPQGIVDAIKDLLGTKNLDREDFQEVVESAFISVLKKKYTLEEVFMVTFNMDKGDIEIYREWEVIGDEELENEETQLPLSKARELDPDLEEGDEYIEIIDYRQFGRRAITNLKQALMHKIREIEKNAVYEEYKDRVGEIIHADVHQVNRRGVILNIDRTEFLMPPREQVRSERYFRGSSIRVLIKDVVRENNRDPEIIVSRSDPAFIRRLFEVEVPEIAEGIIQIRAIARVPGRRTKIAVESNDPRIDPVGSCVGMKGVRIQAIVRELENEKIDIINFTSDSQAFIKKAMSPNKPLLVSVTGLGEAVVVLNEEEYGKMIERQKRRFENRDDMVGEFVFNPMEDMVFRLAAEITGFKLTLVNESDHLADQLHSEEIEEDLKVIDVEGINPVLAGQLIDSGYLLAEGLLDDSVETIREKTGMSEEQVAQVRRRVAAYFQDIKIADVADLPRAYKEALISGGFHTVEQYLDARMEEVVESTGLDPEDLAEITRVLSTFDTQVED